MTLAAETEPDISLPSTAVADTHTVVASLVPPNLPLRDLSTPPVPIPYTVTLKLPEQGALYMLRVVAAGDT